MHDDTGLHILHDDPVAHRLLCGDLPARLGYTSRDGTPRVVPMWFHWTGTEFLMGAPPNAPKLRVLGRETPVGLVIDDAQWPYQVLTIQGVANVEVLGGAFPEYAEMARRYLGEEGAAGFMDARDQTFHDIGWARIAIRPLRAQLLDFGAGKFPSAWSRAVRTA